MTSVRVSRISLIAWSLLGAGLFAVAWPPLGWWPLIFVCLVPLGIVAIEAPRRREAFLATWLAQTGAWLVLEFWLIQLTPPGYAALALMCGLYPAVAALVIRRIAHAPRTAAIPMVLVMPVVWCGLEYLRTTLVLNGYPWFQLGTALAGGATSDGLFAQSASLIGANGLSLLPAATAGALVDWIRVRRRSEAVPSRSRRAAALSVAAAFALVAADLLFGVWWLSTRSPRPGPRVLAIQTNLSMSNKAAWNPQQQRADVTAFIDQSIRAADQAEEVGTPVDLIAWPETMVPGFGLEPDTLAMLDAGRFFPGSMFAQALADLRVRGRAPLLVGSPVYLGLRADRESERWLWDTHHNSAYLIDGAAPHPRYDKLFLTPFGEVMPIISRWDWLEEKLLAFGAPGMTFDLEPGERPVRFLLSHGADETRIATPICFEDTVPHLCRRLCYEDGVKVADLMVNLSNDGWLGWSQVGREHHVLHARLRCIELAVPMVRCANTGLSVFLDDRGRVRAWIGTTAPGDSTIPGALIAATELVGRSTAYGRFGDLVPWGALAGAALLVVRSRGRRASAAPIGEAARSPGPTGAAPGNGRRAPHGTLSHERTRKGRMDEDLTRTEHRDHGGRRVHFAPGLPDCELR